MTAIKVAYDIPGQNGCLSQITSKLTLSSCHLDSIGIKTCKKYCTIFSRLPCHFNRDIIQKGLSIKNM